MTSELWHPELESKPWQEVESWQSARLASFANSLRERSIFYGDHWREATIPAAPSQLEWLGGLPFTSKTDLRRAQDETTTQTPFGTIQAVPLREVVQVVSSSGTSGRPVVYGLTQRDVEVWSDGVANMFFTAGIRPEDTITHLTRLPMVAGGLPYADALRRLGATLVWAGGLPTERTLRTIQALHATALTATVSFEVYLTEHCESVLGVPPSALGLRKLIGGGEPGMGQPEIRDKIRRGWGIDHVREAMGLSDVMAGMWAECEAGEGMHFTAQRYVAVELIDPESGAQVEWSEGSRGEPVYSTFEREATPLLRFRSGDAVVVSGMGCACGRSSPKIQCVGRTDDMLIYKAMNVFPTAIRDLVLSRFAGEVEPHVRIWKERPEQVRFDDPIPLDVEVGDSVATARRNALSEEIERAVRDELQVRVAVSLVSSGAIPRSDYKTPLVYVRE